MLLHIYPPDGYCAFVGQSISLICTDWSEHQSDIEYIGPSINQVSIGYVSPSINNFGYIGPGINQVSIGYIGPSIKTASDILVQASIRSALDILVQASIRSALDILVQASIRSALDILVQASKQYWIYWSRHQNSIGIYRTLYIYCGPSNNIRDTRDFFSSSSSIHT